MAVDGQGSPAVRAYLEYFRDMGVYEFYRNGEPGAVEVETAPVAAALEAMALQAAPAFAEAKSVLADTPIVFEAGTLIPKLSFFQ